MQNRKFDCILIPGGGLLEDGSVPEWTIARLEKALNIQHQTDWIITLSGGTVHKPPPLNSGGFPIYESRKAAEFLISSGFDPKRVLTEISSFDTIGNAYFSRILFTEPMALLRCHIITSEFHASRTEAAFRWIYSLPPISKAFILSFDSVPNIGLSPQTLKSREKREKESLHKLQRKINKIKTLSAFQHWLFTEHAAYSAEGKSDQLAHDILESY